MHTYTHAHIPETTNLKPRCTPRPSNFKLNSTHDPTDCSSEAKMPTVKHRPAGIAKRVQYYYYYYYHYYHHSYDYYCYYYDYEYENENH